MYACCLSPVLQIFFPNLPFVCLLFSWELYVCFKILQPQIHLLFLSEHPGFWSWFRKSLKSLRSHVYLISQIFNFSAACNPSKFFGWSKIEIQFRFLTKGHLVLPGPFVQSSVSLTILSHHFLRTVHLEALFSFPLRSCLLSFHLLSSSGTHPAAHIWN